MKIAFFAYSPNILGGPSSWLIKTLPRLLARGVEPIAYFLELSPEECSIRNEILRAGIKTRSFPNSPDLDNIRSILGSLYSDAVDCVVADYLPLPLSLTPELHRHHIHVAMILRSDEPYYHRLSAFYGVTKSPWQVDGVAAVSKELINGYPSQDIDSVSRFHCPSGTPIPPKVTSWGTNEPLKLLYTGRIEVEQKCIDQLVDQIIRQVPEDGRWELTLIGSGTYQIDLKRQLLESGVQSIQLLEPLPHTELMERLPSYHALLMGSDYEGLSSSLQEAMAAGLVPIIREMPSGLGGFLQDRINGLCFKRDFSDLGERISWLLENRPAWELLSEQARKTAENEFDSETCANRWRDWLESLLERPISEEKTHVSEQDIPYIYIAQKIGLSSSETLNPHQSESLQNGQWLNASNISISNKLDTYIDWMKAARIAISPENILRVTAQFNLSMELEKSPSFLLQKKWATLLSDRQEYSDAIAQFLDLFQTAKQARDKGLIAFELGCLHHKINDNANAVKWHRECLNHFPGHRKANDALDSLA